MILKLTAGYRIDLSQIARIAWFCNDPENQTLNGNQIADKLGISYARLQRLWMVASALGLGTKGRWKTTELGQIILNHDRFLDDVGTLWLLHYRLSSNPDLVVWHTMIHQVMPENRSIDMETAKPYFLNILEDFSEESFRKHLNKEINSFFDVYCEQKFSHLSFMQETSSKSYAYASHLEIPNAIMAAALYELQEKQFPSDSTLSLSHLTQGRLAFTHIFNLSERQLRDQLDDVKQLGLIYVETRADLDQVRLRNDTSSISIIHHYYKTLSNGYG